MRSLFIISMFAAVSAMGLAACGDDANGPSGPATPGGVAVQQLSLTSVRVTWNAASGADQYIVERSDATNPGVFAARDTVAATQFDDTGLTAGLAYSYRVIGWADGVTSSPSTAVTVTTVKSGS